jgi:hypothetical protein
MFTIIAYMSGILLILLLAESRMKFLTKFSMVVLAMVFLFYLQIFKLNWRIANRKMEFSRTEAVLRTFRTAPIADFENVIFPIYIRINQGFNIALVQRRIPSKVDYIGGENLALSFLSSFVPRLFWPDKPEAGGKANMKLYTGFSIEGWSTNVGPIGEAYGSFGVFYGCLYLLVFCMFIRAFYLGFLHLCDKIPILLLWMPVLFYQTVYVMETDSLQAFNSLLKGTIFMIIMYKGFPVLFGKSRQ